MMTVIRKRADYMPTLNSIYLIDFPQEVAEKIKSMRDAHLGGDKYLGKGVWEVTEEVWERLKHFPHTFKDEGVPKPKPFVLKIDKDAEGGMYAYQDTASEELRKRKNALLFFDTGTGKTRTSLSALSHLSKDQDAMIVVGEGNLSQGWKKQAEQYFKELAKRMVILNNGASIPKRIEAIEKAEKGSVFIVNIESVRNKAFVTAVNRRGVAVVILDECQYIIGTGAQQTAGMHDIQSEYRWALSATPIKNSPLEWHSLLAWLRVVRLKDMLTRFREHYSYAVRNKFGGWDYTSFRNEEDMEDLKNLISLRVEKTGLELPDKKVIDLVLPQDEELKKVLNRIRAEKSKEWVDLDIKIGNEVHHAENLPTLFYLERLATAISNEKIKVLRKQTEEPMIVVSRFKFPIDYIQALFPDEAVLYHGDIPKEQREENLDAFITGKKRILLMTRKSGGTGLDGLQEVCSKMFFLDAPDNKADFIQCSDRVHRIRQKQEVEIYLLKVEDSLDTYAWEHLDEKERWVDRYYKVNYEGEEV